MTASLDLGPVVAALDESTIAQLAERLRAHLERPAEEERLLTTKQAAERLGLHPKTVSRMVRDGRLRAVKLGRSWRFRSDELVVEPAARVHAPERERTQLPRIKHQTAPASARAIRDAGAPARVERTGAERVASATRSR